MLFPLQWLSFWLRLANPYHPNFQAAGNWLLPAVLLIGLLLMRSLGNTKASHAMGSRALIAFPVGLLFCVGNFRSDVASDAAAQQLDLLWLLLTGLTGALRFALRDILLNLNSTQHKQQLRVAIYGAGEAGAQLAAALRLAGNHTIISFLDDNPVYWNRSINGVPIRPPQELMKIGESIDQVLLAIPSLTRSERRHIVDQLQSRHPCLASTFCR